MQRDKKLTANPSNYSSKRIEKNIDSDLIQHIRYTKYHMPPISSVAKVHKQTLLKFKWAISPSASTIATAPLNGCLKHAWSDL